MFNISAAITGRDSLPITLNEIDSVCVIVVVVIVYLLYHLRREFRAAVEEFAPHAARVLAQQLGVNVFCHEV